MLKLISTKELDKTKGPFGKCVLCGKKPPRKSCAGLAFEVLNLKDGHDLFRGYLLRWNDNKRIYHVCNYCCQIILTSPFWKNFESGLVTEVSKKKRKIITRHFEEILNSPGSLFAHLFAGEKLR